jgi:hypothetical protein
MASSNANKQTSKIDISKRNPINITQTNYTDPKIWRKIFTFDLPTNSSRKDELIGLSRLSMSTIILLSDLFRSLTSDLVGKKITFSQTRTLNVKTATVDEINRSAFTYTDVNIWHQVFAFDLPAHKLTNEDILNIRKNCMQIFETAKAANRYFAQKLLDAYDDDVSYRKEDSSSEDLDISNDVDEYSDSSSDEGSEGYSSDG